MQQDLRAQSLKYRATQAACADWAPLFRPAGEPVSAPAGDSATAERTRRPGVGAPAQEERKRKST